MKIENVFEHDFQDASLFYLKQKYAHEGETRPDQIRTRVANALAMDEAQAGRFLDAMSAGFIPAGRINRAAGSNLSTTMINCFVQPVSDTISGSKDGLPGIFNSLRQSAETMRLGGGVGYDFSLIRPKGAYVNGTDSSASGPISYMRVFDRMCETVISAGSRRGAQMGVLRIDHPDIEEFIGVKAAPDFTQSGLSQNQADELIKLANSNSAFGWTFKQAFAKLTNFNLSVAVTDKFMEAVAHDREFDLVHEAAPYKGAQPELIDGKSKYIYKTVRARDLWDRIMRNTYNDAEPGVLFIDRINADNNLRYVETINATNPCGEQSLPNYGCCCLGSHNLSKFVRYPFTPAASFDFAAYEKNVAVAVELLDRSLDVTNWPLPEQKSEAESKRRIGLGFLGLADTMAMLDLKYGTPESAAFAAKVASTLKLAAYRASVELAKKYGAFPFFSADEYLADGTFASRLPQDLKDEIREHGIRNSHLLSIAPTGTISLTFADNASSGIEPIFSLKQIRMVHDATGKPMETTVLNAAYRQYVTEYGKSAPLGRFVTIEQITIDDHLRVIEAVAPHIDAAISKTVNVPSDYAYGDFSNVYMRAWKAGLKGITTYRPNVKSLLGAVLIATDRGQSRADQVAVDEAVVANVTGSYCSTCNTMNLVKRDGCDLCTHCGYLGSCG